MQLSIQTSLSLSLHLCHSHSLQWHLNVDWPGSYSACKSSKLCLWHNLEAVVIWGRNQGDCTGQSWQGEGPGAVVRECTGLCCFTAEDKPRSSVQSCRQALLFKINYAFMEIPRWLCSLAVFQSKRGSAKLPSKAWAVTELSSSNWNKSLYSSESNMPSSIWVHEHLPNSVCISIKYIVSEVLKTTNQSSFLK